MIEISPSFIKLSLRHLFMAIMLLAAVAAAGLFWADSSNAQTAVPVSPSSIFRIGERLSYTISFGKIPDAGYAETHVISRGKLSGKDAVEVRGKIRTQDVASAAFFLFDEARTTFAAPDTGLPLYITTSSRDSVVPKETIANYLAQPTSNFDLLTLIFKLREAGGAGTFPVFEDEQLYTATLVPGTTEKIRTDAGDFETVLSTVQSDYFAAHGIKEFRINFSADEHKIPVQVRFKWAKGDIKATLTSISMPEPELPSPTPTPQPTATPKTKATPNPSPTPPEYIDNQPLLPELGFQLGEVLKYRINLGDKLVGTLILNARERKLFEKADSLLLTATATGNSPGDFSGSAAVQVDPETLTPSKIESKSTSLMPGLSQTVVFDKRTGAVTFDAAKPIDSPVGTHTFLSLIYAMRSFNLKPSKDLANPVNDTRVAVFWESKSYVFTLRPSNPTEITINGEKASAQLITIKTDNKDLDGLGLKVWLATESRIPLRFSAGPYQADLVSQSSNIRR